MTRDTAITRARLTAMNGLWGLPYSLELELETVLEYTLFTATAAVFESLINRDMMFSEIICILICLFQKSIRIDLIASLLTFLKALRHLTLTFSSTVQNVMKML